MNKTYQTQKLNVVQDKFNYTKQLNQVNKPEDYSSDEEPKTENKITAYNDGLDLGLADTAYDMNNYNYKTNKKMINKTIE